MKLIIFFLFCLPYYCFSQKVVTYWDNGQKKEQGKLVNGIKEGHWKQWDKGGTIVSNGEYKNGLKEGDWVEPVPYNFIYDSLNFPYIYNGNKNVIIQGEGKYKNGLKTGVWICNDAGIWFNSRTYLNDTLNGEYLEYQYYFQGSEVDTLFYSMKGFFEHGKKTGEWIFLNTEFISPSDLNYNSPNENFDSFIFPNMLSKGFFYNDKRDSVWQYWGINEYLLNFNDPIIRSVNILDSVSVNKYIDRVEQIKMELKNDSVDLSFKVNPVVIVSVKLNKGKFEGDFNFEKIHRSGSRYEFSQVKGKYFNDRLDSVLTKLNIQITTQPDSKNSTSLVTEELNHFAQGKKSGWSDSYENIDDKGFIKTLSQFYRNDSLMERHDYTCVDWGGENEHAYTKYKNGFPVLVAMVDSLNQLTETVLHIRISRDSVKTISYDGAKKTESSNLYYNTITSGEVFDLSITGDSVFHYIYFDSLIEIQKVINAGVNKKKYYRSVTEDWFKYQNFVITPPCKDISYEHRYYYYHNQQFNRYFDFPPGHYKYWSDGFLAGELYKTIINGQEYFYYKEWMWNTKYNIQVSRNSKLNSPSVIERDGKVYTDSGIYLFTPDLNKNH